MECSHERFAAVRAFVVVGVAAVLAGGLIAAAGAHHPSRHLVWLVAYLVLIVGSAQIAFGLGQAVLAAPPPATGLTVWQWLLFNVGNIAVMAGTLGGWFAVVAVGTAAFLTALALFASAVRGAPRTGLWWGYHALLAFVAAGALVGVVLSAFA